MQLKTSVVRIMAPTFLGLNDKKKFQIDKTDFVN